MQVTVREIHISESDHLSAYFLRVDSKGRDLGSGFQLLLTDGHDAWRGEVSEAVLRGEAEDLEMQMERYLEDLQQALRGTPASVSYTFSLTPAPPSPTSSLTLAYEKVQRDISFRLGSVLLEAVPDPAQAVRQLLIHGLERGKSLLGQNQNLQEENHRLRREQQHITAEMKRYTGGKEALEAELYSRFVLVLNEKKAKIRHLQDTVTQLQEARSLEVQTKRHSPSQTPGQEGAQEDDVYRCSTDEELEGAQPVPPASTSASQESCNPSPLDESLNDITDVAPCRKRRFRHLRAPDLVAKRASPQTSHRQRSQTPVGSADAASTSPTAEDLFEDF